MYIWMDGWLLGAERESERNIVWYEAGSAKILNRQYLEEIQTLPLELVVERPAAVEQALSGSGVATTRRVVFPAELFVGLEEGEGSLFLKGVALDPETDGRVFRLAETVQAGRFLRSGEPELLLGEWLARDLGTAVGDWVTLRARTRYGAFQTLDLEVVGILNCPNPLINQGMFFLPLDLAEQALEMEGAVSEIALSFPEWQAPAGKLAEVRRRLAGFPELAVADWRELARDFLAMTKGSGPARRPAPAHLHHRGGGHLQHHADGRVRAGAGDRHDARPGHARPLDPPGLPAGGRRASACSARSRASLWEPPSTPPWSGGASTSRVLVDMRTMDIGYRISSRLALGVEPPGHGGRPGCRASSPAWPWRSCPSGGPSRMSITDCLRHT